MDGQKRQTDHSMSSQGEEVGEWRQFLYHNKKCHSHVTNAPKGIGLA